MLKKISKGEFDNTVDIVLFIQSSLPNGVELRVSEESIHIEDTREEFVYLMVPKSSKVVEFEVFNYEIYKKFVDIYNEWLFERIIELQKIRSSVMNNLKVEYAQILKIVGIDDFLYEELPVNIQRAIGYRRKELLDIAGRN